MGGIIDEAEQEVVKFKVHEKGSALDRMNLSFLEC